MRTTPTSAALCLTLSTLLAHCAADEKCRSVCGHDDVGGSDGGDSDLDGGAIDPAGNDGGKDSLDGRVDEADEDGSAEGDGDANDAAVVAPPGLDSAFGSGGFSSAPMRDSSTFLVDLARQPDGKLVAVGTDWSHSDVTVFRMLADGSPDEAFGVGGSVILSMGIETRAIAVAVQSEGKIVVLLHDYAGLTRRTKVVRLLSDGSTDSSWGDQGQVIIPNALPGALALQPDGKVLVATGPVGVSGPTAVTRFDTSGNLDATFNGGVATAWSDVMASPLGLGMDSNGRIFVVSDLSMQRLGVACFTPQGQLDDSFAGDGTLDTDLKKDTELGHPLAVQADGKVLVGGYSSSGAPWYLLARYDGSGVLDNSFSGNGYAEIGGEGGIEDIDFDLTGAAPRIVVLRGGSSSGGDAVYRLDMSGALDAANFGTSGRAAFENRSHALVVADDGKLVMAGETRTTVESYNGFWHRPRLVAATAAGALDTTWASGGIAWVHSKASLDEAHALVATADGSLIAVGRSNMDETSNPGFTLAKYSASGAIDTNFGSGGFTYLDLTTSTAVARGVALDSMGRIWVSGGTYSLTARFSASGERDASFGTDGQKTFHGTSGIAHAYAMAIDHEDRVLLGGGGTISGMSATAGYLVRVTSDGELDPNFGVGGRAVGATSVTLNAVLALAVRADGKIVVTGNGNIGFLGRYAEDGTPDATFTASSSILGTGRAVDLMADGRILVAGSTMVNPYLYALDDYPGTGKLVVARFLEDGKPDTSFAEIGSLTTDLFDLGISAPAAFAVRAGPNGKIFVAGTGLVSGARRGFVLCLRENGAIESTFGSAGVLLAPTTAEESALFALIRHGTAGLVAAGYDFARASGRDFFLTRLSP